MILNLKKIFLNENEHLEAKTEFDMSDISAGGMTFIPEPVSAEIKVGNHAGLVSLKADVCFRYHFLCDRCCEHFSRDFAYGFSHILVTDPPEDGDDDYIEAPDYMLDTDALLRDDILLELPSKFLCKDSCKGLCPKCGKNLNEGKCNCPEREPDPRLAALSRLLEE
ncbi:MAG: DUF177 domain-containing protein [Clostridia bacterium]|nr:DUF177 domain-containing protein [Clostridia bacterium]